MAGRCWCQAGFGAGVGASVRGLGSGVGVGDTFSSAYNTCHYIDFVAGIIFENAEARFKAAMVVNRLICPLPQNIDRLTT